MKQRKSIPPELADRFLCWFCKRGLQEEVLGDLHEYYRELGERRQWKNSFLYWFQVFRFIRPFALKNLTSKNSNHLVMIQHHFKIARRNIIKQKVYAAIKIGGFSLGIAACLIIALFIQHELSYDRHYVDGDRIYRVVGAYDSPTGTWKSTTLKAPMKEVLENDFPEIEKAGRLIIFDFYASGNNQLRPADQVQNTYEEGFIYADPEMLEILEIPMVYGQRGTALSAPNTMVISKRKADKYFPGENPVGRLIILNNNESDTYKIGGVMENFPPTSHLQHDFLLTLTGKEFFPGSFTSWDSNIYDSYVKLKAGSDPVALEKKLLSIRDNYIVSNLEQNGDQFAAEIKKYFTFELQPVSEIYLHSSEISDFYIPHGDIKIVRLFGVIAIFILLLACVNFVNLSTAKSANRAREVGLRKAVGSYRRSLISQFMTESMVFSLVSFVIGTQLAWLSLPYFNELAGKSLVFPWSAWWLGPVLILSVLVTGLLAGCYPAFYLSGFKPVNVLKGSLSRGTKSSKMRGGLVVFQFATSIVLIICTIVTYQQMAFILNAKIGYDKEQVVMVLGANTLGEKALTFKNELLRLSEVEGVTQSDYMPVSSTQRNGTQFWKDGRSKIDKGVGSQIWFVDEDYINTLGMKLADGRGFSAGMASDSSAIIINQALAKGLGLTAPLGEWITYGNLSYQVIGVVEDFYFDSIKGVVRPLAMVLPQHVGAIVGVKVNTADMAATLESITAVWKQFMPNQPIRYTFLDDTYARMYADVERTGKLFTVFAVLAIVVACLGLFALSAFMAEQRGKEVGIRKVLGASLASIFGLLTGNFLRLVLIAFTIAAPIGWYIMIRWLQDYDNKVTITWRVFAVAGLAALLIALVTISGESIKAALTNPAKKLRSE